MTDNVNPVADLPGGIPDADAREYGAALVRNGMNVDDINRSLASRGVAPLVRDSLEMAEFSRDRLFKDAQFMERFANGDPEAVNQLHLLDVRIAQGGGKLTDHDPSPEDYDLRVAFVVPNADPDGIRDYCEGFSKLAAALKLPPEIAQSLAAMQLDGWISRENMTAGQRDDFASAQTAMLHNLLGADAEAQIKEASRFLTEVTGTRFDIAESVELNGADIALTLMHQAQHLKAARSGRGS
ncbi:MAG TPA: hypothetical protein VHW69_09880 [Rhizomicrobium sp.]|nr:hypothetical protein [Rhizomicrobium sp.]